MTWTSTDAAALIPHNEIIDIIGMIIATLHDVRANKLRYECITMIYKAGRAAAGHDFNAVRRAYQTRTRYQV